MKKRLHVLLPLLATAAIATAIALPLGGCAPSGTRPNLLLITVDTLRPDRLGYAGYPRPTSPRIDGLAETGVVFTKAYSQSGWTLPSVATIQTGKYPSQHGATDFHWAMNPSIPTLASILSAEGYETRAFVSHVFLLPRYGMDKGFSTYDSSVLDQGDPHKVVTSDLLTAKALGALDGIEEPFFLWVHYFDPHFDYIAHEPWVQFGDSDSDRYDQEIAFTDREIGRLLDGVESKGLTDRTVILFTSDHGEEFGEHQGIEHETCYEEVVRVPLIVRAPYLQPKSLDQPAEQIDLLPTLLGLLDVESVELYPGRDLFRPNLDPPKIVIERDRPPGYRQRSVVREGIKLIEITETDLEEIPEESRSAHQTATNVIPGLYLFDLQADPRETTNLVAERRAEVNRLRRQLRDRFGTRPVRSGSVKVDPELQERLRSLGYIR